MKKVLLLVGLTWMSVGLAASSTWTMSKTTNVVSTSSPLAQAPTSAAARPAPVRSTATQAAPAAPVAPAANVAEYKQMLNRYCVTCHNERMNIPSDHPIYLDKATLEDPGKAPETWERVVRKLAIGGSMPPLGAATPGNERLAALRSYLITSLDRSAPGAKAPGKFVLHRLNRTEYANAIRDLLAVNVDVSGLLPSDGGDFGFDNVATALPTSPLLLERYMTAALRIADLAVGDTAVAPGATVYPISLDVTQREHVDGLPLGTRGGILIHHIFPSDADYLLSVRLNRTILNGYSGIEGNEKPQDYVVTVDGQQVYTTQVGGPDDHKLSADDPQKAGPILDQRLKARVAVTAGPHDIGFTWIDKPAQDQQVWQPPLRDTLEVHMAGGVPRIRAGVIEGPYNSTGISDTVSRDRIFVCRPTSAADETACAQKIVSSLTRRAYRRAVTAEDTDAPMAFYTQERKNGGNFDAGVRAVVARVLASPSFVYRAETDPAQLPAGSPHLISDIELASRLSFFLWSSIPDEQLLNLATAGKLRQPGVLQQQVRRMLNDEKSNALVSNFTGQWLQLRNLEAKVSPDLLLYPDFDDNVRKAFRTEIEMFFGNVLRNNESTLTLMEGNYTFLNERLAKHYGVTGVYGTRFRKVALTDPNRFGLLGKGGILAMTSVSNRTSPTIRGKYIMSVLLNTPPSDPPPVVPALEKSDDATKPRTVKQQLELHRSNAVCASCHRNIDPVGFALENFDSAGQWRDKVGEFTVDNDGMLVDGRQVKGPVELRKALLSRPELFVGSVTQNLMIYALGRGLEPSDLPLVRKIVRTSAPTNYRLMSIVMGIVQSAPFQMRTKIGPAEGATKVAQVN